MITSIRELLSGAKSRLPRLRAPSDEAVLAAIYTSKGMIYGVGIALVYAKLRGVW